MLNHKISSNSDPTRLSKIEIIVGTLSYVVLVSYLKLKVRLDDIFEITESYERNETRRGLLVSKVKVKEGEARGSICVIHLVEFIFYLFASCRS